MVALGIIIGILIMVAAYGLSMLAYFFLRRKYSSSKYGVEIFVLAFAILVSVGIKTWIFYLSDTSKGLVSNDNFLESMALIFKSIYSGIGGLTFEGLSEFEKGEFEKVYSLITCLYAGSSLYAGLMVLSVLTAKLSYEISSSIRFSFFKLKRKISAFLHLKDRTDYYFFTAVTEESLTLAKSVSQHYADEREKNKRRKVRKPFIMFTGPDLEEFDGKNELHREIMARNYYYKSYIKKTDKDKGIFSHLKLKFDQDFFKCDDKIIKCEADELNVHLFAMDTNEKLSGLEATNSDIVFTEIKNLVGKLFKVKKNKKTNKNEVVINKMTVIDFYVLADNDINYEFYQREVESYITDEINKTDCWKSIWEACKSIGAIEPNEEQPSKEDCIKLSVQFLSSYFQVDIISEAELAGKCLEKERKNVLDGNADIFIKNSEPDGENLYRVMVLGFGSNGQQSMKHLYQATSHVSDRQIDDELHKNVPSRFVADVYDPQCTASAGLFGFKHPMFVCVDKNKLGDNKKSSSQESESNEPCLCGCADDVRCIEQSEWVEEEQKIKQIYTEDRFNRYMDKVKGDLIGFNGKEDAGIDYECCKDCKVCSGENNKCRKYLDSLPKFDKINDYLQLPVVAFHQISAFEDSFLKYLDKQVGDGPATEKSKIRAFIIALGNDEYNITMANALINDMLCESALIDGLPPFDGKTVTIYVNIRDKKNYDRINWTKDHEVKMPALRVVIYGNSEEMFSYDNIVNDDKGMIYNYLYGMISNYENFATNEKIENILRKVVLGNALDSGIFQHIPSYDQNERNYYEMRKKWLIINSFKKQSNYAANEFSEYYKNKYDLIVDRDAPIKRDLVISLGAIEHERWMRFHISNGWYFSPDKNEKIKHHKCICPFQMLPIGNITYDLINVLEGMNN